MKNILKIVMIILKIGILDWKIIAEIDGIGRFAILLFGSICSGVACIIPFEKKINNNYKEVFIWNI